MTGSGGQGQGSSQESRARPGQRRMAQWTRDYVRLPGIPDEYIAENGAPRPVWASFFDAFVAQRAQLLEMVLADLYGEGRLVTDGAIPAAAIAGSSEYLRAVSGIKPP